MFRPTPHVKLKIKSLRVIFLKKYNITVLLGLVIIFSFIVGCNKTASNSSTANNLSYDAYHELVQDFQTKELEKGVLSLEKSTLNNPLLVMVNKEMSFGKKQRFLSLHDEQKDSVQELLSFREKSGKYIIETTWMFTESSLGNNLLMVKPPLAEKPVYDDLLSYKNILIHVQLIPINNSNQNLENTELGNAKIVIELNEFLTNYK
ncbi:MAG: hypothetical protein ACYCVD_08115 [Desulfitobacteriaceae bacterium]